MVSLVLGSERMIVGSGKRDHRKVDMEFLERRVAGRRLKS